jgi:protein TonB
LGIGNLDNHPRTTTQVSPVYPEEMKRQGIEGTVIVEFIVDESGRVTNPRVVKSDDPAFEAPTLRAVAGWRFEPGRKDGRRVSFKMAVPVSYKLDR